MADIEETSKLEFLDKQGLDTLLDNLEIVIDEKVASEPATEISIGIPPENDINYYSLDEKIVGQWIDGKRIYQKTVPFGELPKLIGTEKQTTKTVTHGINNIDKIIKYSGIAIRDDGISITIPYSAADIGYGNNTIWLNVSRNDIVMGVFNDRSTFKESYITIQYTKTIDEPVSTSISALLGGNYGYTE